MHAIQQWLSELSPSQRVPDLGCGPGSMKQQMAGLTVVGIDVDGKLLAATRDRDCVCGLGENLPFADRSFDLIIGHHSLEHFHDAEAAIRGIRRVLKPSGLLFIPIPDGASFSDNLYRLMLCGGGICSGSASGEWSIPSSAPPVCGWRHRRSFSRRLFISINGIFCPPRSVLCPGRFRAG